VTPAASASPARPREASSHLRTWSIVAGTPRTTWKISERIRRQALLAELHREAGVFRVEAPELGRTAE
jgi:hypothetical protein